MIPLDLKPLEKFFDSRVRQRARDYARDSAVSFMRAKGDVVVAIVTGSNDYEVVLRYAEGTIACRCTCPYFEDEDLCKHIWATLLMCERKRFAFSGRATNIVENYERGEEVYGREVEFENDDADDAIVSQLPTTDDFAALDSRLRQLRGLLRGSEDKRVVAIRPRPLRPSRWREQISRLRSWEPDVLEPAGAFPEITWIIDPRQCRDVIALELTKRPTKKNGEPGQPQSLPVTRNEIQMISDARDREIVAALFGAYAYRESRLQVSSPLAQFLIPRVVATGRLLMRVAPREYVPVSMDEGAPFELRVTAEDRGGEYALVPNLVRGDDRIPLADALAFSPDFVFFRGAIARIADRDAGRWARVLRDETVTIPKREVDDFLRALAQTDRAVRIEFPPGVQWSEKHVAPRASIRFHRGHWNNMTGVAEFIYEENAVNALVRTRAVYDEKSRTIFVRDREVEEILLNALRNARLNLWGENITCDSAQLAAAVPALLAAGWEVSGEGGIYTPPLGDLQLSITSGIDWFDLEASVDFGTQRISMPRLLEALRKNESLIPLGDGRIGLVRPEWRAQLEPFLAIAAEESGQRVRFRKNQLLILDALLAARPEVSIDDIFETARKKILEAKIAPQRPPKSFRGELRPYQSDAIGWFAFLRELGFGGCLADDMGLGKTVQVLALFEQRRTAKKKRPSLVVAPRSVIFNWKSEAERFTPKLRLLDHSTPDRERATGHFDDYDVVLTTYALLRKDIEALTKVEFDYVVLDESQAIKNASSQSAKAATLLKAQHRLALSGTPIENHLGELGSLFEFLNPGMLRGKSSRMSKLLRGAGANTAEAAEQRAVLSRAVRPFVLRRTKAQVASDLPARTEQTIYCELEAAQRKLYDELRDYYRASLLGLVAKKGLQRSKIHVLEALLRMRQAACHPGLVDAERSSESSAKIDVLFERLPVLIEEQHKVLVFSQFTSMLAIVRREMEQRGIPYAYLDGKTRDRAEQVRRFQEDADVPLFLISLKAGGLGLNLTAAEYVYLLDPWWNPAVEAQAIDRAHRIGQSRNVFAYRLVARDTIEEKILLLQQSKRALADAIISEENSILRTLTTEDLELLLS